MVNNVDAEFIKKAKKASKYLEGMDVRRMGKPRDWSEELAIEIVGLACNAWDWKRYLVRYGQETKVWWKEAVEHSKSQKAPKI